MLPSTPDTLYLRTLRVFTRFEFVYGGARASTMPMPTSELSAREGPAPASGGRRCSGHTAPLRGQARALRRSARRGTGRDRGGTPARPAGLGAPRQRGTPRCPGRREPSARPGVPGAPPGAAPPPPGPSPRLGPPGLRPRRAPSRSVPGQPRSFPPPPASGPAPRLLPASPTAPALPVWRQPTRAGSASCSRRARPTATAPGGGGGACCSIALLLLLLLLLRGPPPPPPGRSHPGPRRHVPGPAERDPQCPGPAPGLGSARTPGTPARRRRTSCGCRPAPPARAPRAPAGAALASPRTPTSSVLTSLCSCRHTAGGQKQRQPELGSKRGPHGTAGGDAGH